MISLCDGTLDDARSLARTVTAALERNRHRPGRYFSAFLFIALGVWGICLQGMEELAEVVNALHAIAPVLNFPWALSFAIYHIGFWAGISHGLVFAVLCTVLLRICLALVVHGLSLQRCYRDLNSSGSFGKKIDAQHSHPRGL